MTCYDSNDDAIGSQIFTCWWNNRHKVWYIITIIKWCSHFFYICSMIVKKLKNVSCENDRLIGWNSTFFCKLRGTSDTRVGRAYSIFHLWYLVWYLWTKPTIYFEVVVNTQFHNFYGKSFARVLYLTLMKDIGRWLPWILPGSTGRFFLTILRTDTI